MGAVSLLLNKIENVTLFQVQRDQKRRRLQRRACLQQGFKRYWLHIATVAVKPIGLLIIWTHLAQFLIMQ